MKQNERTSFSLRDLLLFTAAMSVVFFISAHSEDLFPLVLPLGIGLAIFAANTEIWLYAWIAIGGLLAAALFYAMDFPDRNWPRALFEPILPHAFILGPCFGLSAGLLRTEATRKLGLWIAWLFVVLIGVVTTMLIPGVQ